MLTPAQMLGLPKFDQWYPGQEYIFEQLVEWMNGENRFACAPIPAGFGKTLLAILTAFWGQTRTAYLTSTKGLQAQLMDDFGEIELKEIMGRGSYVCNEYPTFFTDSAPCTYGFQCPTRDSCQYFSRLAKVKDANLVSTNYSYWLHQHGYSDGMSHLPSNIPPVTSGNPFGLLILDEAHTAARWIESYKKVELDHKDLDRFESQADETWEWWQSHATHILPELTREESDLREEVQGYAGADVPTALRSDYKWIRQLAAKVGKLSRARDEWVPEYEKGIMHFTPIDPRVHNQALFLNVPKILVMSAVMTPRAAKELGIPNPTWIQSNTQFDPARAPFIHVKTIRVDYKWTEAMRIEWVATIDNILRTRRDRKTIIHTGSYERAEIIRANSRFSEDMLVNTPRNIIEVVNRFKRSSPGTILVSPSVTTGYDFPGKECEVIIWGKVPWPFTNTPLAKARKELDETYSDWEAMKTLVQGAARGNRRESDTCEVIIVDDHWTHFWKDNKEFAPEWFHERVNPKSQDLIPAPIQRNRES